MIGRRHSQILVVGFDPFDQRTLFWFARHDCGIISQVCGRPGERVQAQIRLPLFFIRTMTRDAMLRENRTDV